MYAHTNLYAQTDAHNDAHRSTHSLSHARTQTHTNRVFPPCFFVRIRMSHLLCRYWANTQTAPCSCSTLVVCRKCAEISNWQSPSSKHLSTRNRSGNRFTYMTFISVSMPWKHSVPIPMESMGMGTDPENFPFPDLIYHSGPFPQSFGFPQFNENRQFTLSSVSPHLLLGVDVVLVL